MPSIQPSPGVFFDKPRVNAQPFWAHSVNMRWRGGEAETIGFMSEVRDIDEAQIVLPGVHEYRGVLTTPSSLDVSSGGQMLFGSLSHVMVLTYDPLSGSSLLRETRWIASDITPVDWEVGSDELPSPATGAITIPPNPVFIPQDDLVVLLKCDSPSSRPWTWDRVSLAVGSPVELSLAPPGAVGAAIVNRHLVLLGCESVAVTGQPATEYSAEIPPDPNGKPLRFLTVRWSDQFNFDSWAQHDATASGELQLDSGTRIVGGGRCRHGVAVWTDEALWLLTYVANIDIVFEPKQIDGSTGLMSNQSWCEGGDGRIWYFDSNRRLMVFDGGTPRAMPNPNKLSTIERLSPQQIARAYMFTNPEYDEVVLCYPQDDAENGDTQLAFNYALNAWYPWRLERTAWNRRKGGIDAVAVDHGNALIWQDIDSGIEEPYLVPPSYQPPAVGRSVLPTAMSTPGSEDVIAFDCLLFTNPISTSEVTTSTMHQTRIHWDRIATTAVGAVDEIELHCIGYGEAQIPPVDPSGDYPGLTQDVVSVPIGQQAEDFRSGGKAIQIGFIGYGIKSQLRMGAITFTAATDGER